MNKHAASDEDIHAFMAAVYPTGPALAMAAFDEREVLREATRLIAELRQSAIRAARFYQENSDLRDLNVSDENNRWNKMALEESIKRNTIAEFAMRPSAAPVSPEPPRKLHCVTQIGEDSWEYRRKRPHEEPNCDDVILWDDALAMVDRVRSEHHEWDKRRVAELEALRARRPSAAPVSEPKVCVHGHTTRQVGCVSCVLLFGNEEQLAAPVSEEMEKLKDYAQHLDTCEFRDTWTAQLKCTCGLDALLSRKVVKS